MTDSRKPAWTDPGGRASILRETAARVRRAQAGTRDRFRQAIAGQTVMPFWKDGDDR